MIPTRYAFDGCYEAPRAAALSGVPVSTVYYWARTKLVVPTVSPDRKMLWSYADLMGLRVVSWLRHPKQDQESRVPASPMTDVRKALARIEKQGLDLWSEDASTPLRIDRSGKIFIGSDELVDARGQAALDALDLLAPFAMGAGRGPDLRRPRPHLRIVPGKCAGEPHIERTRVTTLSIAALAGRGFELSTIASLYPALDRVGLKEAIDLERELAVETPAA